MLDADGTRGPVTHVQLTSADAVPYMVGCTAAPDRATLVLNDVKQREERIVQVDVASGRVVWEKSLCSSYGCGLSGPAPVLSPDGRYLAYADANSALFVVDFASGHQTRLSVRGRAAAFTADASQLLLELETGPNGSMSATGPVLRLVNWAPGR